MWLLPQHVCVVLPALELVMCLLLLPYTLAPGTLAGAL